MSDEFKASCGFVKLYHPSGALVSLPVPGAPFDYAAAFANVSGALAAGFLVAAPGLEAGEEREEVGYVLRREKVNGDRTETPVIDLYSANDAAKFKVFSVYLNREEDVEAFERASGLSLASLRVFPGTAAPERGANKQSDSFIARAPRPFGVVLKPNPKFNPDETDATKKKPKRLFVRWAEQKPAAPEAPAAKPTGGEELVRRPPTPANLVKDYAACATDEEFARCEDLRRRLWDAATADDKLAMKDASEKARKRLAASVPAPAGRLFENEKPAGVPH